MLSAALRPDSRSNPRCSNIPPFDTKAFCMSTMTTADLSNSISIGWGSAMSFVMSLAS